MCSMAAAQRTTAQLTLDGADRLHDLLGRRHAPIGVAEAASCLFALRSAPVALARQLVDEVVRADARFVWRSGGELALAEWEAVGSLLDEPLERVEYVVFDLETTGTSPTASRILEIGAVRLKGFHPVSRFQRLVDPGRPVPAAITAITGIDDTDVRGRPHVGRCLDEFLHFSAGAVLVAHNARFDVAFVDAELGRRHGGRLAAPVIDTVALARRLMDGRLPRMSLAVLAERFDTAVRPCHRALPDAEATSEVLARLLGMAQETGAQTVGDVIGLCAPVARVARRRRELAAGAPNGPGVYLFWGRDGQVLYVGKATDLRARVRSYFSGGPERRPVEDALRAVERIETRPLGSEFEAALVELELILRLRPPANRRSARPERACYLTLTVDEPYPRLQVTAAPSPGCVSVGPITSRSRAQAAAAAVREAFGLRVCRPLRPVDDGTCLAGALGRCHAPCRGGPDADRYAAAVDAVRRWLAGDRLVDPAPIVERRMRELAGARRFEEAAAVREQLTALRDVAAALGKLRTASSRAGVVLAPDVDDRFVQAFACAGGRVVARRRLPRAGDAALEVRPLVAALEAALPPAAGPLAPEQAEQARIVSPVLVRPGVATRPLAVDRFSLATVGERIADLRPAVPLRV
jgi:DNA polymerase III subunit epsilon